MPALKITLKKSLIGYEKTQGRTARALGLGKIGSTVLQADSSAIRGMISKIEHVLVVETVDVDPPAPKHPRPADAPAPVREKRRRPNPTHAPRKK